jgi:hypothetical protein
LMKTCIINIFLLRVFRRELKITRNRNNTCDTLINLIINKSMTTTGGNIYHNAMR